MYFILYIEDRGALSSNTVEKPSDISNWGSLHAMIVIKDVSRLFRAGRTNRSPALQQVW